MEREKDMESVLELLSTKGAQYFKTLAATDSSASSTSSAAKKAEKSTGFESLLQGLLLPDNEKKVSEEELFAGVVEEQLQSTKGEDVAKQYHDALESEKTALKNSKGMIPYEDAAKNALKQLRDANVITSDEADKVYSEAFSASQLDSNSSCLWDRYGGANDQTVSLADVSTAISSAQNKIDAFTAGSQTYDLRSLNEVSLSAAGSASTAASGAIPSGTIQPSGTNIDGKGGFLFKPVSNSDGKLAVILPASLKGLVSSIDLVDSTGKTIESGKFTSNGDTGTQSKYSFSKPGSAYSANLNVRVTLNDGSLVNYIIPDPSQRYD